MFPYSCYQLTLLSMISLLSNLLILTIRALLIVSYVPLIRAEVSQAFSIPTVPEIFMGSVPCQLCIMIAVIHLSHRILLHPGGHMYGMRGRGWSVDSEIR